MGKIGGGKRRGRKASKHRGRKPRCTEHPVSRPVLPAQPAVDNWVDAVARAGGRRRRRGRKAQSEAASAAPQLPHISRDEQSPRNVLAFAHDYWRKAVRSPEELRLTLKLQRSWARWAVLLMICGFAGVAGIILAIGWAELEPSMVAFLGFGSALTVSITVAAALVKRRRAGPKDDESRHAPGRSGTGHEVDAKS